MSIEFPSNWYDLRFPSLRAELLEYLADLAADDRLKKPDDLDFVVHFLFDDTDLADPGRSTVGLVLFSEEERQSLLSLTQVIGVLVDELGDATTAKYVERPVWHQIRRLARSSLDLLTTRGVPRYY